MMIFVFKCEMISFDRLTPIGYNWFFLFCFKNNPNTYIRKKIDVNKKETKKNACYHTVVSFIHSFNRSSAFKKKSESKFVLMFFFLTENKRIRRQKKIINQLLLKLYNFVNFFLLFRFVSFCFYFDSDFFVFFHIYPNEMNE